MKAFVWSFGEKPERSMKREVQMEIASVTGANANANEMGSSVTGANVIDANVMAGATDMDANINTNTNMSISIMQMGQFRKANNKRETVNSKLDERHSIGHIGQNPFHRENNYIKDLENQQNFMMPKSSYDEKNTFQKYTFQKKVQQKYVLLQKKVQQKYVLLQKKYCKNMYL